MEALEAVAAIHQELSCPLCHKPMRDPQTFNTPMCGHTFCRECVIATLEGPGIVKSQCPTCRQPSWKKDLHTNHKYTAIAEATAQLESVLREQGLDFGLFDGLDEPTHKPVAAAAAGSADTAAAGDQNAAGNEAGMLLTVPTAGNQESEPAAVRSNAVALNRPVAAALTARQEALAPVHGAGQVHAGAGAEPQQEVIPDSGSADAAASAEELAVQANPDLAAAEQEQQPSFAASEGPGGVSHVASPTGFDQNYVTTTRLHGSATAAAGPHSPSPGPVQPNQHTQRQACQNNRPAEQVQQQLERVQLKAEPPNHLQQLLEGQHDEQLPGHAYWQFQQVLANMLCAAALKQHQGEDQLEQLPETFHEQLGQLPAPMAAEVQQLQMDLQHIDGLLHEIDAQIEMSVKQQAPDQQQQQQQLLQSHDLLQDVAGTVCTTEEPTEAPSGAEEPQKQQQQQPGTATGIPLSLGQKRRRGRASGRSRAAGALSNTAYSLGAAGVSGGQLGACSGGMVRFSNCSGPLLEYRRSRPSLEKAFTDAMAAARHATEQQADAAAGTAAAEVEHSQGRPQQQGEQQQPGEEEQQHHRHQQQQQQEQAAPEGPVSLSTGDVHQRPVRQARVRRAAAAAATNSGSMTSGAEGCRRSSRKRRTVAVSVNEHSQAAASVNVARAVSWIGYRVKVRWPDGIFYPGTISDYNAKSKKHLVNYDDGDIEKLDLDKYDWYRLSPEEDPGQQQQQQQVEQAEATDQHQPCQLAPHTSQQDVPSAHGVAVDQQQQQQEESQQPQLVRSHGQQAPGQLHPSADDAVDPSTAQPSAGHAEGQQQEEQPHLQQQTSIYSMRQQLLQAKGLAQWQQWQQPQQQQQRQQSILELQQQLLAAKGLAGGRRQQQHQQQQPARSTKRSRGATAGKRKRQQYGGSDSDAVSSSSSSLRGSDVTSGGDSAYEADEAAVDSDDSEEYAGNGAAAGAKKAATLVELDCESDLEVAAAAAAGSDGSDSFVKQSRRAAAARRRQATARKLKEKKRQQQNRRRCRSEPPAEAAWHRKQPQQQQQQHQAGSTRPSEPPPVLLLSDSDPEQHDQPLAKAFAAAAGQVQQGATARVSCRQQQQEQDQEQLLQQRQQSRHDELLKQELAAAWAVMSPQLDGQSVEQSSSSADDIGDSGSDANMQPQHQSSAQSASHSSHDELQVPGEAVTEEEAEQQQRQQEQGQAERTSRAGTSLASNKQQQLAFQQQKQAWQQQQQQLVPQSRRHQVQPTAQPCHQQQPHAASAAADVGTTLAAAVAVRCKTPHHQATSSKHCDLLSDSLTTTTSSSQAVGASEEQDENAAAAVAAQQHPGCWGPQLVQMPHAAAGATGVVCGPADSSTAHKQPAPASRRQPLENLVGGKQRLPQDTAIAGAGVAAVSPGAKPGPKVTGLTAAAAAAGLPLSSTAANGGGQQQAAAATVAAQSGAHDPSAGGRGVTMALPLVIIADRHTATAYKPRLEAVGAKVVTNIHDKYTHCVVVPVDERDYFSKASKTVLTALLMGVPLVKQAWLEDSVQQGHLLPVQGYLPKGFFGPGYQSAGGPARSLAARWHVERLFEDLLVVLPALEPTDGQIQTQNHLAGVAKLGHAQVVLQGPTLDKLLDGISGVALDAAAAAQLCVHRRVLVVLYGDVETSARHELRQQWLTDDIVVANYLTDCICAYKVLDVLHYRQ